MATIKARSNTLLVVTGASRGIGRAISVAFSNPKWKPEISSLCAVLIARNKDGLNETKELMMAASTSTDATETLPLSISCHCVDLANLDTLEQTLESLFESLKLEEQQHDRYILINNAGILEPIGPVASNLSFQRMRQNADLNITSGLFVSSCFARHFAATSVNKNNNNSNNTTTIVNISSLAAVQPLLTMGVYCASKAARDMYHAVLAQELAGDTSVKVLNYAPGPCDTEMNGELCNSETLDTKLREYFVQAKQNNTLVQPKDTADKLAHLVLQSSFESGAHVDYFDVS